MSYNEVISANTNSFMVKIEINKLIRFVNKKGNVMDCKYFIVLYVRQRDEFISIIFKPYRSPSSFSISYDDCELVNLSHEEFIEIIRKTTKQVIMEAAL